MRVNKPEVCLALPGKNYGLLKAYTDYFAESGWQVRKMNPGESLGNCDLVIAGFLEAARMLSQVESISTERLAIDFQYRKKYEKERGGLPFHLLDNATVIIHDYEAETFLRDVIRPINARIFLFPYPSAPETGDVVFKVGQRKIYTPAPCEGHPWFTGFEVEPVEEPFPMEVTYGSFIAIPEYDADVWPTLRWGASAGLPFVAPGVETFQRIISQSSLLFDPESEDDFRLKIAMLSRPGFNKPPGGELRIGVVAPRYGKEVAGGAEIQAAQMAAGFINAGHSAEILTTCNDSMSNWNNNLPEGKFDEDGLVIRRFPLDSLDSEAYHKIGHKINLRKKLSWTEETEWMRCGIRSSALERYLEERSGDYDYLFFIPYLYGTTYWASQIAPEKSFLIPCYHDEPPAFTRVFRQNAQWAAGLLLNSVAEKRLAEKTLGITNPFMLVAGEGVDTEPKGDSERFRNKYGIKEDFLLYVGRVQREKNIPLLLEHFKHYANANGEDFGLVIAGKGDCPIANEPGVNIKYLGFIPEVDKIDAYKACLAFVLPSTKESFSIVMMEAWLQGRPVLANAECNVAREHIFKCGGGVLYSGPDEFEEAVNVIRGDKAAADKMGMMGREYVLENFQWEKIICCLVDALDGADIRPLWERMGKAGRRSGKKTLALDGDASFKQWLSSVRDGDYGKSFSTEASPGELLELLAKNADIEIKYNDFSHRAMFGSLVSRFRNSITRHIRKNYIEVMESKQSAHNRETVRLLKKLYDEINRLQ